jgi:hypothetical protein
MLVYIINFPFYNKKIDIYPNSIDIKMSDIVHNKVLTGLDDLVYETFSEIYLIIRSETFGD